MAGYCPGVTPPAVVVGGGAETAPLDVAVGDVVVDEGVLEGAVGVLDDEVFADDVVPEAGVVLAGAVVEEELVPAAVGLPEAGVVLDDEAVEDDLVPDAGVVADDGVVADVVVPEVALRPEDAVLERDALPGTVAVLEDNVPSVVVVVGAEATRAGPCAFAAAAAIAAGEGGVIMRIARAASPGLTCR
jgi:hypothetical protein